MFKSYYLLTKPGIIYSNVLTATGGFFLAAKGHFDILLFLAMLFGLGFVIASACVFNNYIDRGIDSKMTRTQKRALVTKQISVSQALLFAAILGIFGFSLLLFYTNLLTAFVAFIGFFFYVVIYSIWKRRSEFGTVVGSVSGAVPPVVGYCAVTNRFDIGALLLFFILVVWQMPHFYAIATFRSKDYAAASIPVLPLKKGMQQTKVQMLLYIIAFLISVTLLTLLRYTGYLFLLVILALGIYWLVIAVQGFYSHDEKHWARQMFFFSLILIGAFSILLMVNDFLP